MPTTSMSRKRPPLPPKLSPKASTLHAKAAKLMSTSSWSLAILSLDAALSLCPDSPILLGDRCACQVKLGNFKEAEKDARKVLGLEDGKGGSKGWGRLAGVLEKLEEWDEAADAWRQAIRCETKGSNKIKYETALKACVSQADPYAEWATAQFTSVRTSPSMYDSSNLSPQHPGDCFAVMECRLRAHLEPGSDGWFLLKSSIRSFALGIAAMTHLKRGKMPREPKKVVNLPDGEHESGSLAGLFYLFRSITLDATAFAPWNFKVDHPAIAHLLGTYDVILLTIEGPMEAPDSTFALQDFPLPIVPGSTRIFFGKEVIFVTPESSSNNDLLKGMVDAWEDRESPNTLMVYFQALSLAVAGALYQWYGTEGQTKNHMKAHLQYRQAMEILDYVDYFRNREPDFAHLYEQYTTDTHAPTTLDAQNLVNVAALVESAYVMAIGNTRNIKGTPYVWRSLTGDDIPEPTSSPNEIYLRHHHRFPSAFRMITSARQNVLMNDLFDTYASSSGETLEAALNTVEAMQKYATAAEILPPDSPFKFYAYYEMMSLGLAYGCFRVEWMPTLDDLLSKCGALVSVTAAPLMSNEYHQKEEGIHHVMGLVVGLLEQLELPDDVYIHYTHLSDVRSKTSLWVKDMKRVGEKGIVEVDRRRCPLPEARKCKDTAMLKIIADMSDSMSKLTWFKN